jgi:hypothetical protein
MDWLGGALWGVEGRVFPPDFSAASKKIKEIIFNLPILLVGLFAQILTNSCELRNLTLTHFHSPPQHPALPYSFHKLSFIHVIFAPPPLPFLLSQECLIDLQLGIGVQVVWPGGGGRKGQDLEKVKMDKNWIFPPAPSPLFLSKLEFTSFCKIL